MTILILNYSHPLTTEQLAQATQLLGDQPMVRDFLVQIDRTRPIIDVACDLVDAADLTPIEWQALPLVVNPPGLAPLALALLAEIHGRCGHFPAILNIRPMLDVMPPRYEIAEIVNLQTLRDAARRRRSL